MSSWERSRYIPWDRIPQDGSNLEHQKEKIFRELQRETILNELTSQPGEQTAESVAGDKVVTSTKTVSGNSEIPYSNMELLRQAAFGGTIGAITGGVFGFMDGMRTAGESQVLQKASNMAKGKYLLQGTTRSATLFGVFFSGFHIAKYGVHVTMDPGEIAEIGIAGVVSMGALMYKPAHRASVPYAAMLIFMDGCNLMMRRMN